jgi:acetoin utilization deacetylase AcuC-like enzyme
VLKIAAHAERGILRSAEFAALRWDAAPARAGIADVLRVHEWAYVRDLQSLCASLAAPVEADGQQGASLGNARIGHLDGDTALSAGSFRAALAAAGAVLRAVDRVVAGEVGPGAAGVPSPICMRDPASPFAPLKGTRAGACMRSGWHAC